MYDAIFRLTQNLIYSLQKVPAADHSHFRFRTSLGHPLFYFCYYY